MQTLMVILLMANCVNGDADFIRAYFQEKFIRSANIYTCKSTKDRVNTFKSLMMKLDIPISMRQINRRLEEGDNNVGMVLDANCDNLEGFLKQCDHLEIFDHKHHWILMADSFPKMKLFSGLHLNVDSDFKLAVQENFNWNIYDIFKPSYKHSKKINVTYFGNYSKEAGIYVERKNRSLYEERSNMTGVHLKALVVLPDAFEGTVEEHVRSDKNLALNHFNRYNALLCLYISEYYNFTLTLEKTYSWGYAMPNGTIDGVVGALQRHEIDFGGSPLFMTKPRYAVVDYGRRTWKMKSAFIFRHPKRKASFQVFLRPMDKMIWFIIALSAVMAMIAMKIIIKMETITLAHDEMSTEHLESTWSSLVLFVVGSLCQQGNPNLPVFLSGRIVAVFFFVTSVLLYQFYSGSIVSYLLMQPAKTLKTIEELASSSLKLGSEDVLFAKIYFQQLSNQKLLNKKWGKYEFFLDPDIALPLVAKGGFAYHVELATAYPIIERTFDEDQICDLEEIALFDAKPVMACFPKKSPLRDMFNFVLQKMAERGVMKRQLTRFHARQPDCIRAQPKTTAVGMGEFYSALVILAIGMIVSLIVLVLECMVSMAKKLQDDKLTVKPFTN